MDDGHSANNVSNTLSVSATVTPVNDAPTVVTTGGTTEFTEGDAAMAVDSALTVGDVDHTNLAGATVDFSAGFTAGDTLAVGTPGGLTVNFDSGTGVLTLSGSATLGTYQTALRSVTYYQSGQALPTANRTVRFVVDDGVLTSGAATKVVQFNTVNSAPVLTTTGGSTAISEGAAGGAVDAGLTVTDPDNANLASATVSITSGFVTGDELQYTGAGGITGSYVPGTGVLTLTGLTSLANWQIVLRSVRFVNAGPLIASGTRTITFTVSDPGTASDTATKGVTFTAVDNPPTITTSTGDTTWVQADVTPVVVDPAVTTTDPDSTDLTEAVVTITNAQTGDRLALDPGVTVPGSVTPTTTSGAGTFTLTLTGSASVGSYQALLRAIRFDSTNLTPNGVDRSVSFRVSDATTAVTAATNRTVKVVPDNDPPVAVADSFTTNEDTDFTGDVRQNDTDADDLTSTLRVDQVNGSNANVGATILLPNGVTAAIDQYGAVAFDIAGRRDELRQGVNEQYSLTYRLVDPQGATSNTATATLTVSGVNDAPTAVARTYNAVKNVAYELEPGANAIAAPRVRLTGTLLAGATDPDNDPATATITDETKATSGGGSVDLDADGSFVYVSEPGESAASDSFSFTINDVDSGSSTQTVNFTFRGSAVWFADADANAGTADGTSLNPFTSVATATSTAATGDVIHVGASASEITASATLKNGQTLVGAGRALTADLGATGTPQGTVTLVDAGTAPVLATSGGSTGITLATNSTVQSLVVNPSGTARGIYGASTTGVTIADVNVNDTGTASSGMGIVLLSATATLTNVGVVTQNAQAIALSSSTVTVAGTSAISATGGPAIVTSGGSGTLAFGNVSSTNSPTTGISIGGSTSFSATGGSVSGATGIAVESAGGNQSFTYAGSITGASATAAKVSVTGRTGGTTTLSGPAITGTAGPGIVVSGNTGGTTSFTPAPSITSGASDGVSLTNNGGATINFGGVNVTSTTGTAFRATGGGTVTATGSTSTLTAGAGTALRLENISTGSTGVLFRSASSNGGSSGISLDTVSGPGGVTISGDGSATRNTSGGTIANVAGADNTAGGNAIYVKDSSNVTLSHVGVTGAANHGLYATGNVSALRFEHGSISGSGTADADTTDRESNVRMTGATGTVTLHNVALSDPKANDVYVTHNAGTGALTVSGNSLLSVNPGLSGRQYAGVLVDGGSGGTFTTTITGSTVQGDATNGAAGPLVDVAPSVSTGTANWTTSIGTSTFTSPIGSAGAEDTGGEVRLRSVFNGTHTYAITGNTIRGAVPSALALVQGAGSSEFGGTISGNTIGTSGTERSATRNGSGILVDAGGNGSYGVRTSITDNTIHGFAADAGIWLANGQGGGNPADAPLHATVTNNVIGTPYTAAGNQSLAGIYAGIGAVSGQFGTSCLDLAGNQVTSFVSYVGAIYVDIAQNVVVRLPSYAGGPTQDSSVETYLSNRNPAAPNGAVVGRGGSATWANGACLLP